VEDANSVIYGFWMIKQKYSLKKALDILSKDKEISQVVDDSIVRGTYAYIMRRKDLLIKDDQRDQIEPSKDERDRAGNHLLRYRNIWVKDI